MPDTYDDRWFYHGTLHHHVPSILRYGLRPRKRIAFHSLPSGDAPNLRVDWDTSVYVSTDPWLPQFVADYRANYACASTPKERLIVQMFSGCSFACHDKPGEPVLIRFHLRRDYVTRLLADEECSGSSKDFRHPGAIPASVMTDIGIVDKYLGGDSFGERV